MVYGVAIRAKLIVRRYNELLRQGVLYEKKEDVPQGVKKVVSQNRKEGS